ncbi:MAG TPA: hypothetical protein VEU33_04040 [Archangium sp.]|nr:hypothetical protein [Archangium sp.]
MADTSKPDVETFVNLSVTLTQLDESVFAPFADKINLKQQYLDRLVKEMGADKVNALFQRYNELVAAKTSEDDICDQLINPVDTSETASDFSFMARNILKMWYLGAWFPRVPEGARTVSVTTERGAPSTHLMVPKPGTSTGATEAPVAAYQVISSDAYVRGLAWRAMQAHPMGFSNFAFGYWSEQPPSLTEFLPPEQPPKEQK